VKAKQDETREWRYSNLGWWAVVIVAFWLFGTGGYEYVYNRSRYAWYANRAVELGMAIIAIRAFAAIGARNKSWIWIFYIVLLFMLEPMAVLILTCVGANPSTD
jgi:hypothetical protein